MSVTLAVPITTILTGEVRRLLVLARVRAMHGDMSGASAQLSAMAVLDTPQGVAAGSLLAELLHLDCQDVEAAEAFDRLVLPKRSLLSAESQFVLDDNRSVLRLAKMEPVVPSTFYHAVDRRRVAGFESLDSQEALKAETALSRGNPAEALPILWRGLTGAYRWGDWSAVRRASSRLGRLYLPLGSIDKSWHYILLAEAEEHLEQFAEVLGRQRNVLAVRAVIDRSLRFANLRRHFALAAQLFAKIAAIIPDDRVHDVVEWLLARASENRDERVGPQPTRLAWEALSQLGWRVSMETAIRCIQVAITHPVWIASHPGEGHVPARRKDLVEAVNALATHLPSRNLSELAEAVLPLALDKRDNNDYALVVNLLCCIASRGVNEVNSRMAAALYPANVGINRILAQVVDQFGVAGLLPSQAESLCDRVVRELQLSIQCVTPDKVLQPMPEMIMIRTSRNATGELAVMLHGIQGLEVVVRERLNISPESIGQLVEQLILLISHRDNLLTNRVNLLTALTGLADHVTRDTQVKTVAALAPLATGSVLESAEYPTAAAGANPLSSWQVHMGTPEDVQANALVAFATFAAGDLASSRRAKRVINEAMTHPSPTVRCGAYSAAARLPSLSGEGLLPLVVGLRDPDPVAARAAFAAFARQPKWSLKRMLMKQFLHATRLAEQSPDAGLRRNAAVALRARRESITWDGMAVEADQLLDAFGADIDAEVRNAVRRDQTG